MQNLVEVTRHDFWPPDPTHIRCHNYEDKLRNNTSNWITWSVQALQMSQLPGYSVGFVVTWVCVPALPLPNCVIPLYSLNLPEPL